MKNKSQNIQQLIREQQRPNEVSIKLQSNLTETTHHGGRSPTIFNTID